MRHETTGQLGGVRPTSKPDTASETARGGVLAIMLVIVLTLLWGANFPAIKVTVAEMPVLTFRVICLVGGAAGVAAMAVARGWSLAIPRRKWGWVLTAIVFNTLGWNLLTAYGLTMMPAGRGAIIAYTMPFWAVVFAALVLGEPISRTKLAGLALGIAGLATLIGPDLAVFHQSPLGVLLMLGAALSWGLGTVVIKGRLQGISPWILTVWLLGAGAIPIIPIAFAVDDFDWRMSVDAWLALGFVLIGGMILAHVIWFSIVRILPASIASISTLAIPVVGVTLSALILGEPVGLLELAALCLVVAGLFVVLVLPALRR